MKIYSDISVKKIPKDFILFKSQKNEGTENLDKLAAGIFETIKVFDITLSALKDSGQAPLSLDLSNTQFRNCPQAQEPAWSQ